MVMQIDLDQLEEDVSSGSRVSIQDVDYHLMVLKLLLMICRLLYEIRMGQD